MVLFLIELSTQRVQIAGISAAADGWMNQIARNVTDPVKGLLKDKRYLIHNRDPLFTAEFLSILEILESQTLTKLSLVVPVRLGQDGPMRGLLGFLSPQSGSERNAGTRTLGHLWCSLMHEIRWPIHGHYRCASCGRLYSVPWENVHGDALPRAAVMPKPEHAAA